MIIDCKSFTQVVIFYIQEVKGHLYSDTWKWCNLGEAGCSVFQKIIDKLEGHQVKVAISWMSTQHHE